MSDRPKSLFKSQKQAEKVAAGILPPAQATAEKNLESPKPLASGIRDSSTAAGRTPVVLSSHDGPKSPSNAPPQAPAHQAAANREASKPFQDQQHSSGPRVIGEDLRAKIDRYERFLDETLRVKLQQVYARRAEVVKEIEAYEKLGSTLKTMQGEKMKSAKASINIGCDIYMQAIIPDASMVTVDVGLGFFVEMTVDEGIIFVDKKVALLQRAVDAKTAEAAEVSSQIDVVLEGIRELLAVAPKAAPARTFL
jgi:prefoldin alpha subunit